MKLWIFSDLHLEYADLPEPLAIPEADVCVVAGDVCNGSGAPLPDLSIEVDNIDAVYARATKMGCDVVYRLRSEPWGVRRFFVADPTGKLINILEHSS